MSWKENIKVVEPDITEQEREIIYRNLGEFCKEMYYKYIDKKK